MVLEKLYIADLQKVSGNLERKICAVGVSKILTETPFLLSNENNLKIWYIFLLFKFKNIKNGKTVIFIKFK